MSEIRDRVREQVAQEVYEIAAKAIAQFIDEFKVSVRKPREWSELPDEPNKNYWRVQAAGLLAMPEVAYLLTLAEKAEEKNSYAVAVVDKEAKLPDFRDMLALVCNDYRILDKRKKALTKAVYELWGKHIESCLAGWIKEVK